MSYEEFIESWRGNEAFVECNTSGSTGTPKTILLPKAMVAESALRTIAFFRLNADSYLHSCISPDFIGGKMMAVRAELTGGTLTWEEPSNRPLDEYSGGHVDLLAVVPSQMLHILENTQLHSLLRNIIIGGAPIHDEIRKRIAGSGLNAWETYGMTETASHIALRRVSWPQTPFVPLPGIKLSLDSDCRLIIEIEGWQKIVTNDIAEIYPDGNFSIIGRFDNVIISGGKKIHPEKLEQILEEHIGAECLVTSMPDLKWGEKVVLIIDDNTTCNILPANDKIISLAKHLLPAECVPKEIKTGPIRHTENGKKIRKKSSME